MSLATTLTPRDLFSDDDLEALNALKEAVYPPEPGVIWDGASREWAAPQWGVFVRDDSGALVSYTGVVEREGGHDGEPVSIGGVGGIATHPDRRGKGYAAIGIGRALDFLAVDEVDFALLVCRDELIPYYERLGWRIFDGELLVSQFGEPEVFTYNRVMVGDVNRAAPRSGTIDLNGPPW
jgi:aminoglycoside 2'-N-acetyltransferase I